MPLLNWAPIIKDECPNKLICIVYITYYKTIPSKQLCSQICLLIVIHLANIASYFFKTMLLFSQLSLEICCRISLINLFEILHCNYRGESLVIICLPSVFIRMMVEGKSQNDILEILPNCKLGTRNDSLKDIMSSFF